MKTVFIILLSVLINSGCAEDFSSRFPYIPPTDMKDGLEVGNLKDIGINEDLLRKAVARIERERLGDFR